MSSSKSTLPIDIDLTSNPSSVPSYVHHTIVLPARHSGDEPTTISALLHPSSIPLLPNPLPYATVPLPNPPFDIKRTDNRGYGMFASRAIRAGAMIYQEHPVFIVPAGGVSYDLYEEVARGIPRDEYAEMTTMANCRSVEECSSIVEGIARTNAVDLQYQGVYLKINRTNHSCGPNAMHRWDADCLALTLFAVRNIAEGEEILTSCVAPLQGREQRQQKLERHYRFTCDCEWCSGASIAAQSKPDAAREFLNTYAFTHPSYRKWSNDPCLPDDFVIKSHLAMIPVIVQEGLDALLPVYYDDIARCYAELGQEDEFRRWAEKTVQLCWFGMPEVAAELREALLNPTGAFAKWGARTKAKAICDKPLLGFESRDSEELMSRFFGLFLDKDESLAQAFQSS